VKLVKHSTGEDMEDIVDLTEEPLNELSDLLSFDGEEIENLRRK